MSTSVQVEIVIPESMGKVEALAKVSTSLQGVIARKRREWRAARGEIAVLGPNVEERPACRLFVYRVARDFGGDSMRYVGSECGKGHVMTVDEEREVVMGELWVSHDELVDAIGDDGADLLCRAVGGVSTYIPRKPVAGSPLSAVLGMERMERLCAAFGGLRVTFPNRRKGEPFKDRIVRMLSSGKSPGNIALELGVTERYVRILARQVKEQPKLQVQLRLW